MWPPSPQGPEDDLDRELRALLRERAAQAPPGDPDRILAAAAAGPLDELSRRRGRSARRFVLPLLAAAAVAAVVATVLGVSQHRDTADPAQPSITYSGTMPSPSSPSPTSSAPPSVEETSQPPLVTSTPTGSGLPSTTLSTGTTKPPPPSSSVAVIPPELTNFRAIDATFYGTEDGWLLGTSDCLSGTARTCPAMMRTTNGGATWTSLTQPDSANVPINGTCAAPCVTHIRFATPEIGYAWGDAAVWRTTDGGQTWTQQQGGGAVALESLDGTTIRVQGVGEGCPSYCSLRVQVASVDSSSWTTASLPDRGSFGGRTSVQFARGSGGFAYLLELGHTAGGAPDQTSRLLVSRDDGADWQAQSEPCPQRGGEVDSTAITAGSGSVSVLCTPRGAVAGWIATATAGGAFRRVPTRTPVVSDALTTNGFGTLLAYGGVKGGAELSFDGGRHWRAVPEIGSRTVGFAGFESRTLGRMITDGGRVVWTTTDGGATWSAFTFRR